MTYMIDRWNEGDVRFVDGAVGWIMKDGEFRPLMSDAVAELHDAGYISSITVEATAIARERYVQRTLKEYADCLLYTSPSPRDATLSRMPSSA